MFGLGSTITKCIQYRRLIIIHIVGPRPNLRGLIKFNTETGAGILPIFYYFVGYVSISLKTNNRMLTLIKPRLIVIAGIIFCSTLYRIIPHPFNFTPIAALGLFAGATFDDKQHALITTLLAMLLADLYLGLYNSLAFTYAGLIATVYFGTLLKKNLQPSLYLFLRLNQLSCFLYTQ